jgi:predicted Rdx family selenoprotein
MTTKLSFTSLSLQEINIEADLVISKHLQDLDRVSNDIRTLEGILKRAGIPFTFIYVLSSDWKKYQRAASRVVDPYEEVPYTGQFIEYIDNCLVWEKDEDGEYRLSHNTYVTENEMEKIKGEGEKVYERLKEGGEPRLSSRKPLIETKSHFR